MVMLMFEAFHERLEWSLRVKDGHLIRALKYRAHYNWLLCCIADILVMAELRATMLLPRRMRAKSRLIGISRLFLVPSSLLNFISQLIKFLLAQRLAGAGLRAE